MKEHDTEVPLDVPTTAAESDPNSTGWPDPERAGSDVSATSPGEDFAADGEVPEGLDDLYIPLNDDGVGSEAEGHAALSLSPVQALPSSDGLSSITWPTSRAESKADGTSEGPGVASSGALSLGPVTQTHTGREGAERAQTFHRETRGRRRRRLAYMLTLEIKRVVEDLALRKALLLKVWSKMRIRQPLMSLLRSRFDLIKPDDLLLLPMECMDLLDQFYRQLDEFRLYMRVTEDMPTSLETVYEQQLQQLTRISRPLLGRLNAIHGYQGLGVELPMDSAMIEED